MNRPWFRYHPARIAHRWTRPMAGKVTVAAEQQRKTSGENETAVEITSRNKGKKSLRKVNRNLSGLGFYDNPLMMPTRMMEQWMDQFTSPATFLSSWPRFPSRDWTTNPLSCDIRETEDAFVVDMNLPGVDKNDIKVIRDEREGTLTVRAERQETFNEETEEYVQRESTFGKQSRTLRFPSSSSELDKVKASFKNGVLHLSVPKSDQETQPVEVPVQES